jgi:hypothetical protein
MLMDRMLGEPVLVTLESLPKIMLFYESTTH